MRVFVAGGSGTIGVPLVRALVQAGHQVTALSRSASKADALRDLGATPAIADALDAEALGVAVRAARPTHVIHQLTALPKEGVIRGRDLEPTNRLRIVGTRNLLDAAIGAGAKRIVGGSFALLQGAPADAPQHLREAANAVHSMESQILDASRSGKIEGIVLRYGLFYGPGNPATQRMIALIRRRRLPVVRGDRGELPIIHIDDAVSATVLALDHGLVGSVYDIVDDQAVSMSALVHTIAEQAGAPAPFAVPAWLPRLIAPYMARLTGMRLPLSNARARAELAWEPVFATWREGITQMLHHAA
jgi:nucleoside-diphosphate-sugar epimerase